MLTFMAFPNYESPADANTDNTYMVMVNANDGTNDAMKTVSVRVTNEEEPGRVTFWRDGADATTAAIVVGDMLTGLAEDPDGKVGDTPPITDMYPDITGATWQWAKSMDMNTWMDIAGATNAAYTVMDDDDGYYLRATAMYSDGEGMGKTVSEKTMMVTMNADEMVTGETLLDRYDDDKDGWIKLDEARIAVGDYFVAPKGTVLSLEDARKVVGLYFEYKNRQ